MRKWGIWTIMLAVFINRFCTILPKGIYIHPFPLFDNFYVKIEGKLVDIGINLQSYAYFMLNHISLILIWIFCMFEIPKFSLLFRAFLILEVLSLLDFLIRYEQPIFNFWLWPVEFTDIKLFLYATLIILWKRQTL